VGAVRRLACLLAREPVEREQHHLLAVALGHSPRVEEEGLGLVYLDVAGLQTLYGGETEIGQRLARAAAERGLAIQVGIAGSRMSALAAARSGQELTVVPPGQDAAYLAPAPLSLLALSDEMATRLQLWGIRTLGELANLPTPALHERLGSEGLRVQRLARGEDARPLRPWATPPVFEESMAPGWAMESLEPLADALLRLAERLCDTLVRRGLSGDEFQWACRLSDGTVREGSVSPAVPMTDASAVALLLKASLASRPPRVAVEAVTLRAHAVRVAPAQDSLIDRARHSPRMLAATLARLSALLGEREIGAPVLLDSYRPDAAELGPWSPRTSRPELNDAPDTPRPVLALRRVRPPLAASVTLTGGRPVHLRSERLTARIVISVGPWRSSGEWWTDRPWIHDEWDVELGDGTLCRLAHDGSSWWLEGIYD
jgi:protein ImuB